MFYRFYNHNLKDLRRIYKSIGPETINELCEALKILPPERPSDLCLVYERDVFYLARNMPAKTVNLCELDFFGMTLPRGGWVAAET